MHRFFNERAGEFLHVQFLAIEIMMASMTGDPCPFCGGRNDAESVNGGAAVVRERLETRVRKLVDEQVCEYLEQIGKQAHDVIVEEGFSDRVEVATLLGRARRIAAWRVPALASSAPSPPP